MPFPEAAGALLFGYTELPVIHPRRWQALKVLETGWMAGYVNAPTLGNEVIADADGRGYR